MKDRKIKLELAFYKAEYEKKKHFWQKGFFSQRIAHHARGTHSHVELVFTYTDGEEYCFSSSEVDGGSRFKVGTLVLKNPQKWDRYTVSKDSELIERVWEFCQREQGKPYDWVGVSRFKLSFLNEDKAKWYCSEICQAALHLYDLFPRLYSIHPEDMFRITRFIYGR